jgi:hypothetical protein
MTFERQVPAPPLNLFVEFLWFYDGFAPSHRKEKLLPDGTMELIIGTARSSKAHLRPKDSLNAK